MNKFHELKKLQETCYRRKFKLIHMFRKFNIDVTGNLEYPSLLTDKGILLYTTIHNFMIIFWDKPVLDNTRQVKLKYKISYETEINSKVFLNYLNIYGGQKVSTIRLANTNLYISGFNLLSVDSPVSEKDLYPVFSRYGKKFYYDRREARVQVDRYSAKGYKLIIS